MTRKLASIQTIKSLAPIAGADRIELATVLGWQVIVMKGEFKAGDACVYIEVDSLLPVKPEFEFLRKSCYKKNELMEGFRIRTMRMKGVLSQGLCLPLSVLGAGMYSEGEDVTDKIGIQKYDIPIPACLSGQIKGQRPIFVPHTDEMRVQVLEPILKDYAGERCYVTEKIDGSSCSIYLQDSEFGVCSRNLDLLETPENSFWQIVRTLDIEAKMRTVGGNLVLQGELVGIGIQGNPLKLKGLDIYFFNAMVDHKFIDGIELFPFILNMNLQPVVMLSADYVLGSDINKLVEMATIKSVITPTEWAEGIVVRSLTEKPMLGTEHNRFSFKVINPEYLIQHEE